LRSRPDGRRPRVAVLTGEWLDDGSEEQFVTRTVAGALAAAAEVHVIAGSSRAGAPRVDGALSVTHLESRPPQPQRARLLLSSVTSSPGFQDARTDVPGVVQRHLRDLNGGSIGAALEILGSLQPDAVVVAGYRQVAPRLDAREVASRFRTVLLALSGTDPQLLLPVYDDAFAAFERTITVTEAETRQVACRPNQGTPAPVCEVGLPLVVHGSAAERRVPDLEGRPYLLVLSRYPDDASAPDEMPAARYLSSRRGGLAVVVVHDDTVTVLGPMGPSLRRRVTRTDLWKLMAGAVATVDLRRTTILGREVLESMLLGTPVVVRHDSISRHHAELSSGGLWFEGPRDLLECIDTLGDEETRRSLGAQARSYAGDRHGRVAQAPSLLSRSLFGAEDLAGGE
jgi:hypothetical protein